MTPSDCYPDPAVRTLIPLLSAAILTGAACAPGPTPCNTPGTCPKGQECLANRCVPLGGDPVAAQSERLLLRPSSMVLVSSSAHRSGSELPTAVLLGSRVEGAVALYLRFDPVWRGRPPVASAFVLLEPMAGTQPRVEDVPVQVWRVTQQWKSEDVSWLRQPRVGLPRARGLARSSPPSTLRIDVTEIIRYLQDHPYGDHGIALKAAGDGCQGATFATGAGGGVGPRLELYL
jgi:hypothetical protein